MPKVSVLMPVYNAEKYLAKAIDSIIAQDWEDWELVIVNDGSTDRSDSIISQYVDKRILYLNNDGNKGLIYTRNLMIEKASGEYIAFLDSDDLALPNRLSKQIHFLDSHLDYGMCGTWATLIDDEDRPLKRIKLSSEDEEIRYNLLFGNTFIQSSLMIRRQLLLENPYDKDYPVAEDFELWTRLARICKLKNLREYLTMYRWHSSNISKEKKELLETLAQSVSQRELSLIGIDATEDELSIHSSIRDKNLQRDNDNIFFKKLRTWLQKLAHQKDNKQISNINIYQATICFKWIFACKERKEYLRAMRLPICLNPKAFYALLKMIYKRK